MADAIPNRDGILVAFHAACPRPAVDDLAVWIDRYRDAIADIERGAFAPRPDPRACPACPYFFVCGA